MLFYDVWDSNISSWTKHIYYEASLSELFSTKAGPQVVTASYKENNGHKLEYHSLSCYFVRLLNSDRNEFEV